MGLILGGIILVFVIHLMQIEDVEDNLLVIRKNYLLLTKK